MLNKKEKNRFSLLYQIMINIFVVTIAKYFERKVSDILNG